MSEESHNALNLKMDEELYEKTLKFIAQKGLKYLDIKTVQFHFRTGYFRTARVVERIRLEQGVTGKNINKD
ncbi:hypothetical protein [Serratia liquefaciens]|uniref:Uncharacterized protein n=1 Tax=Serratia liquefaciens TaxID=614 RepID=A0A515D084_SERLI|nr:hypothetical protein [Serratia liquefaciens]QDL33770.1 hypothetical protein EGO53_19090 [Serratia liquefaciens]